VSDELEGKISRVSRVNVVVDLLTFNLSLTGLSWPLYIGGQVSRNRLGPIRITTSVYDMNLYFDYDYSWT
jgi:hypothetical protein